MSVDSSTHQEEQTGIRDGSNQSETEDGVPGPLSRSDVVDSLTLPGEWEVREDTDERGILLVRELNKETWQSLSFKVQIRTSGKRIRGRLRRAPYRRGRVSKDPVERETFDSWEEAVEWAESQFE